MTQLIDNKKQCRAIGQKTPSLEIAVERAVFEPLLTFPVRKIPPEPDGRESSTVPERTKAQDLATSDPVHAGNLVQKARASAHSSAPVETCLRHPTRQCRWRPNAPEGLDGPQRLQYHLGIFQDSRRQHCARLFRSHKSLSSVII